MTQHPHVGPAINHPGKDAPVCQPTIGKSDECIMGAVAISHRNEKSKVALKGSHMKENSEPFSLGHIGFLLSVRMPSMVQQTEPTVV